MKNKVPRGKYVRRLNRKRNLIIAATLFFAGSLIAGSAYAFTAREPLKIFGTAEAEIDMTHLRAPEVPEETEWSGGSFGLGGSGEEVGPSEAPGTSEQLDTSSESSETNNDSSGTNTSNGSGSGGSETSGSGGGSFGNSDSGSE